MPQSSTIFQITIPACVDGGELSGLLACPEFLGLWQTDESLTMYWKGSTKDRIHHIHEALIQLGVMLPFAAIHEQVVVSQDWNAQWAASVQPIHVGKRIGIRPSWDTMDLPKEGIEIVLDPKQAFGTGHHVTTQLLLEWLEDLSPLSDSRILDVGTGSGILSMVAIRLGAQSALSIDNDAVAIDCANEYAVVNGFGNELELRACQIDELPGEAFEIIVANLDRNTILANAPEFLRFRSSATQLFLSGLLEEDQSDVVEKFTTHGWVYQAIRKREGWIALQFGVEPSGS